MGGATLVGNIGGYIVACLIYGERLPLLSGPAITGILIGGFAVILGKVVLGK